MDHDEMIAVIQAAKEGKIIQRSDDDDRWLDYPPNVSVKSIADAICNHYEVRIKPKSREWWIIEEDVRGCPRLFRNAKIALDYIQINKLDGEPIIHVREVIDRPMTLPIPKPPMFDGNPPPYDPKGDLAERCAKAEKERDDLRGQLDAMAAVVKSAYVERADVKPLWDCATAYAQHAPSCDCSIYPFKRCSCGLDDALAKAKSLGL